MKWEDPLRRFADSHLDSDWVSSSADREVWSAEADVFAKWLSEAEAAMD